uniref:SF3 helicase domain-containing protein n=1 Tax=viral metagenome TaxID=1070528 RepID=A0A6C0AR08_9ZZZZ
MNNPMISTSQFKDLNEFLAKHSAKNEPKVNGSVNITHTRIPDKDLNIYPGAYIIPNEDLPIFYNLYYESIFDKKRKEFLTEKQLEDDGPLVVDFDFRYNHDVTIRPHTREHVQDMICEYLEELKKYFIFTGDKAFSVYIFEKPNVNRLQDGSLTKDGIHMLVGIKVDHVMQVMIREAMIKKLHEIWDLPLINTWESVLDEGISKGTTNWQLFGSRKPGNEAYELTQHYVITVDPIDNEFKMDEQKVCDFDLKNKLYKLSVQNTDNPQFEINPGIIDEYNSRLSSKQPLKSQKKASNKIKQNLIIEDDNECEDEDYISINDIKDQDCLEKAINLMLKRLDTNEYEIKETHEFTQALPERYYAPGSHLLNRQVAFALKHTDERLFLSWVQLRSKASDFDYNSIPELYLQWKKFHKSNQSNKSVTKRSILYWVRKENPEAYEKIKESTIDYYLEKALETGTEYDIALVLKQMFKDKYVCVSYDKKGIWYVFKNHRWFQDKALSLRRKISEECYELFGKKEEKYMAEMSEYEPGDERHEFLKKKTKIISDQIKPRLRKTNDKNNILREAAEIFYDSDFVKSMDINKYLLCFNNGVIDFINKIFREGYPEDYITKCTRINYIPFEDLKSMETDVISVIHEIMDKLFPVKDLNRYMWDHLASCLIGTNKNQTFHVYHGSGSNGKSILAEIMSVILGEYKGTVPITLVTEKRGLIGGTSDEVLKLKGIRYAVMQEPSKGVKLNEGIMKELTGGDPIQARGLYSESEIFEPQFNLVVCTNNLFDIESNDDGTWRRIRKCDFLSKFVDDGETYNDDTPYIYIKDKSLKDKLPELAPYFASMLVKRAFETEGIVENCETIVNASNKYRKGQDHISAFIAERIVKTTEPVKPIGKRDLYEEFKSWFLNDQGASKVPKGEELYEYMNKKFTYSKKGWTGIKYADKEEEDDDLLGNL